MEATPRPWVYGAGEDLTEILTTIEGDTITIERPGEFFSIEGDLPDGWDSDDCPTGYTSTVVADLGTGPEAEANAALIVKAVNCYEKVLDIASADYADDNEAANALLRIKGICEA